MLGMLAIDSSVEENAEETNSVNDNLRNDSATETQVVMQELRPEARDSLDPAETKTMDEIRHLPMDSRVNNDMTCHSLPNPEELERVQPKGSGKLLQTIMGVSGNILEWYDFAVFGYLSDAIAENFFPKQGGDAALIESFVVFWLAFLMRPVGGMIMGYIGDLYGRKRALEISIFLMAFPTFMMGCLPTYKRVGYLSTFLLVCVRMLQGLSVGGQLVSSLVFTVENQPREKWGLYGSYVMTAAAFGTLLGSIIASILRASIGEDELIDWGWRIPFFLGILVCFNGVYLRYYCEDDVMEHSGHTSGERNPIKAAFSVGNRRALFSAFLVPMVWSGGFYIIYVWLPTFMQKKVEPNIDGAFVINSVSLFFSVCLFFPLAGILSDMYSRTKIMYIGGVCLCLLSPLMITVILMGNPVAAFFAQSTLGISLSLWGAPMMAWLVESFPSHVRLTSVAVGYNLAHMLIGGSSPAICTYFVKDGGNADPGYFMSLIALLSLLGIIFQPPKPMDSTARAHQVLEDFGGEDVETESESAMFEDETDII